MVDDRHITVPVERITRLREAMHQASEGGFSEALALLEALSDGEFAALERDVCSLIRDFQTVIQHSELATEEFELSKRELFQKIDTIKEQRAAILELSAPIIDVWEGVVTVPLIGELDSARVMELMARLLSAIQTTKTAWVLLDLTGAGQVDEEGGMAILKLAQAIRLMGAECLLTGISGEVALNLVSNNSALTGIVSIATLREGLRYCLSRGSSDDVGVG